MKRKSLSIRHFGIAAIVLLTAIFQDQAQAQVILGAPGVGLTYRQESNLPFGHSVSLGRYYKFIFTGAEAQADADGVPGTFSYDGYMWDKKKKNGNNGHGNNVDGVDSSNPGKSKEGQDSDPTVDDEIKAGTVSIVNGIEVVTNSSGATQVPGWWNFQTKVNSYQISGLNFATAALHELSDVIRIMFNNPIVMREQTITLTWNGDGNGQDADGHLYILGSAIKEPPVPVGTPITLNQTLYANGEKPPFNWVITRQ